MLWTGGVKLTTTRLQREHRRKRLDTSGRRPGRQPASPSSRRSLSRKRTPEPLQFNSTTLLNYIYHNYNRSATTCRHTLRAGHVTYGGYRRRRRSGKTDRKGRSRRSPPTMRPGTNEKCGGGGASSGGFLLSGVPLHVDRALPSTAFIGHTHRGWDSIAGRGTAAGLGRRGGSHMRS